MALKVRKGYIIALIVIAIIFTGFYSLKFFFKKSLEEELNKVFNAQVKIGKIDLKFFAGQIQIRDILIIGQGEFENDTLISCEKLRLDLEDFDKKTNSIVFGNILLDNLTIKNIISENENLCWDNILNKEIIEKDSLYKDDEAFQKMSVKFRQIVLTDGIIENIDRKNNKEQKLSDIQFKLELNSDVEDLEANFNLECLYSTEMQNELKCRVNGDFVSFKDDLSANAKICLNEFPLSCKFFMNTDSLANSKITINANADLSNIKSKTNNYKGEILLDLEALACFENMSVSKMDYCLLADSLVIKNKNTLDSIFINFEYDVKLNNSESFANSSSLKNLNVCSAKENLTGDFFMELSDTNYCLSSSLNGEFSYKNFAKILELENKNFDFNLEAKSDLKYEYNLHKNSKQGDFLVSSNFTSPVFEMTNAEIEFKNNEFVLNSDFSSKYSKGDFVINFGDFTNYIKQKPILFASECNFSKLIIPKFEIDEKKVSSKTIPSFSSANFKPYISDKLKLSTTCKIDTLNIFEKDIFNIETNFIMDSEHFVFKSNKIILEEGYLQFNFEKLKKGEDNLFITEFDLNNFALNYFLDEDTSISGWLTANIQNTIYLDKEKSAKSYGENKIGLKQFQQQSDIFGEYGIADEKYLKISDFEAKFILKNDSLNLLPFRMKLNDLNADLVGDIDLKLKKLNFNILLDIPEHYYTNLVKVALYAFSEKSEVKLPKKPKRIFRLLKIQGDFEKPKFVIYE